MSHCCHKQRSNNKKNSSGITNQIGRNRYFYNWSGSTRYHEHWQLHQNSQNDNQHLIKVNHQLPDFLFPSFCPSLSPSCIFVLIPSNDPGNNNADTNGRNVLLILMVGNTWRIWFRLILLMTSPNHPATNSSQYCQVCKTRAISKYLFDLLLVTENTTTQINLKCLTLNHTL